MMNESVLVWPSTLFMIYISMSMSQILPNIDELMSLILKIQQ